MSFDANHKTFAHLSLVHIVILLIIFHVTSAGKEQCNQTATIQEFQKIMEQTGTDKGYSHGYYRAYGRFFSTFKYDPIRLLEIGVESGKSMDAWVSYFPNHDHIYGIGYNNFQTQKKQEEEGTNVTLYLGDQSDREFLIYVCQDAGKPFDIIIDDGSHLPAHQKISMRNLMKCLKPGGYYVVEDIETSYWDNPKAKLYGNKIQGMGLYSNKTFIEMTKLMIDVINRQYHQRLDMNFLGVDHEVASITYEQNLVIFRKVDEWDKGFHDRGYGCNRISCSPN